MKILSSDSDSDMQGRCHKERSGFEGPWTANPLIFDNSYFKYISLYYTPTSYIIASNFKIK